MKKDAKRMWASVIALIMIMSIMPINAFAIEGEDTPESPALACVCEVKCTDEQVDESCPVCANDLTGCIGEPVQESGEDDQKEPELPSQPSVDDGDNAENTQTSPQPPVNQPNDAPKGETPENGTEPEDNQDSQAVKDFLGLAEQLPAEITVENAEEYQDLLDDCAQAWEALSETEQEREDVQKAYAQLNTLRDQLNAAQISLLNENQLYRVSNESSLRAVIEEINKAEGVEPAVIELQNDIDVTSGFTISKNITIKSAEGETFRITRKANSTTDVITKIDITKNNLYQVDEDQITEASHIETPQATYNLFNLTANKGELTLDSVILDGATASDAWHIATPETEGQSEWTRQRKYESPYYTGIPMIYRDAAGNEIPYAYEAVITDMDNIVVSTKPMIQANSGTKVTLQNGTKVENIFANSAGAVINATGAEIVFEDAEITKCASTTKAIVVNASNSSTVNVLGDTHVHGIASTSNDNFALFYAPNSNLTFGRDDAPNQDDIVVENNIYHGNGLIGSSNSAGYGYITINSGVYRNNRYPTFIASNAWGCIVYAHTRAKFVMNGGSIHDNYCASGVISCKDTRDEVESLTDWNIWLKNGAIYDNTTNYYYSKEMDSAIGGKFTNIFLTQQNCKGIIEDDMDIEGDVLIMYGIVENNKKDLNGNIVVGERNAAPARVVQGTGNFLGAGYYDTTGFVDIAVMTGHAPSISPTDSELDDPSRLDGYYTLGWNNAKKQITVVNEIRDGQCLVLMRDVNSRLYGSKGLSPFTGIFSLPEVGEGETIDIAPNGHSLTLKVRDAANSKWINYEFSPEELKNAFPAGKVNAIRNTFEFFPNYDRITIEPKDGVRDLQMTVVMTGVEGEELTLPECDWDRDRYDFDGWFYKGKLYQPGAAVQADEDKDFQAIWETATLHPYALTVYADGTFSGEWYVKAEGADKNGKVEAEYRKIEPSDVKVDEVTCTEFPFELVVVDTSVPGVHKYKIQPKEAYKESMITVRGNEDVNDALILFDQEQELTIRDTTTNPNTAAVSYTQTSPESKLQADQVQVYLSADTEMLTNNINGWEVEDKDSVVLLNDEILSQDRKNLLKTTADTLAQSKDWYDPNEDNRKYDFRYLDLMNPDHANAWVTSTKGATVFWGYPSGTDQNTEFILVSFKNLNREDGTGFNTTSEEAVSANLSEFQLIPCSNTEYGLKFELDSDEFGPFMLTWVANDSGGAYHPEYNPDDKDTDEPEEEPEEIDEEEVPLAETPWLNTEDHYAYIIGYAEDGTVRPQANITRAEVATIFFRLLTDEARDQFWSTSNNFSDVTADAWYNNAVSTMVNAGIIQGYEDGTFRPNASITRAEFAAIASRFMSAGYDVEEDLFTDIAAHWARESINDAAMAKWISGYPDGTFLPDKAITRAEAVTLVNNVLQRKPDADHMLDSMIKWPDNMDTSAWYYEAIQEATNSHDYDLFEGAAYETWTSLLENRDWAALEKDWVNAHRTGGEVM